MVFWTVVFAIWLVGAAATVGAITKLGWASPDTIGDSFSGDDTLDIIIVVLWPLFWPCYGAYKLARRI